MNINNNKNIGKSTMEYSPLEMNVGQGSLPKDVVGLIFQNCKENMPSIAQVCKNWKALAYDKEIQKGLHATIEGIQSKKAKIFGSAEWKQYFGIDVGEEPYLPINAIEKLGKDNYKLIFVPKFSLNELAYLAKKSKKPIDLDYNFHNVDFDNSCQKPHWLLFNAHDNKLENSSALKPPGQTDAIIAILTEYVKSGDCPGKYIEFLWYKVEVIQGKKIFCSFGWWGQGRL